VHGPPLQGSVAVTLPDSISPVERQRLEVVLELAAEALLPELGGYPSVGGTAGARWYLRLDSAEPAHRVDRRANVLVTEAPTVDGLFDALSTLRELNGRPDGVWPVRDCADTEEMIARIHDAVADAWPSPRAARVDWEAISARHAPKVRAASDPIEVASRWVAELGDAHTAIRPAVPAGRLRYGIRVEDAAIFWVVPQESAAYQAGVRPGWRLLGVEPASLRARTGATPHARSWVAGGVAQAGPIGLVREWTAVSRGGERASWEEAPRSAFDPPHLQVGSLPSGAGLLRISAWAPEAWAALDEAFLGPLAQVDRLVVDLRGNGGGNLALALAFRDRFVRDERRMGTIRTTLPGGELGPAVLLRASPAPTPWRGSRVRFLTDERTYSASEDALLGLQGLPHVEVMGRPSGGGSGRVRRVRLLPGWVLTVSTALTWDRRQRCVEGQGIPVDRLLPWSDPTTPDPIDLWKDRW
jgi:carboxyl-terminal processing protease